MPLDEARAREVLKEFNFPALFVEEIDWDKPKANLSMDQINQRYETFKLMSQFEVST